MRDGITNIKNGKISVRRESGVLNDFWDQVCVMTTPRRGIEFTCEHDGVEFTVGELKVLLFYFLREKKFWYQLNCLLKSKTQVDYWLRAIIEQTFLNDCCRKPFTPMTF